MLTNAGQHRGSATQNLILTPLARAVGVNSFHEKAGVSQDSFVFTYVDFSVMSDFRSLQGGRPQFSSHRNSAASLEVCSGGRLLSTQSRNVRVSAR